MTALLREVEDALTLYGDLRCTPQVEVNIDCGDVVLTITLSQSAQLNQAESLRVYELYGELRYVTDVAQMRALASRYDISAEQLEALLPKKGTP